MSALRNSFSSNRCSCINRCPEGEAETNGVPDIAVSQSQHERDDKSDEDDTATETPKDISKTTEAHDNSGCTPKEDNGMTDTTNYPGNLDGEEGIGSDQLEETKYVKDDRECNTSGNMVFAWQKQDAEDENHQGPNTRLPGGFGSPETQRTTEESEQKSTDAPADCTLEASFDEEERNGNTDNQQRGAGHEDERSPETFERSPEVERSREDEQSQEEELMLTSEKCDGEAGLNEDNRQWERWMAKPQKGVEGNDGIRGTDSNNVSNKTRYTWGHKRRMRERGKTTEARSRGFSTSNQLQKGPQNTIEGARPTERTRLPTSFLVYPRTETNKRASTCFLPSFYTTWSGYQARACGVRQAVWPLTNPPRVTRTARLWTTKDTPQGTISSSATSRLQCSRREGVPAGPQLGVRATGVDPVSKTKTTKTLVWGPQGPQEIKRVWVLQAHNSRWSNSN